MQVVFLIFFILSCFRFVGIILFGYKIMILKHLFLFIFSVSPIQEGWFPVERRSKPKGFAFEADEKKWLLFVKSFGGDQVAIKFPKDPALQKMEDGSFLIVSERGEEHFSLRVWEKGQMTPTNLDGKWFETQANVYLLSSNSPQKKRFFSSFLVNSHRENPVAF